MAFASIETVTSRGKTRYKVRVRQKKTGKQKSFSFSKTFNTLKQADEFKKAKLQEINEQSANTVVLNSTKSGSKVLFRNFKVNQTFTTVADIIKWDLEKRKTAPVPFSCSTLSACRQPLAYDIAKVHPRDLSYAHFETYCKERHENGVEPSTVSPEILYLVAALKSAASLVPDQKICTVSLTNFVAQLRKFGYICSSKERNRRFESGEAERVLEMAYAFQSRHAKKLPYPIYIELLIETCLRKSELFNLKVRDIDFENERIIIRNLKNTNRKNGFAFEASMTPRAIELFKQLIATDSAPEMPVFPIKGSTFSERFSEICEAAGVSDFVLHDLRREGVSRKFEDGFDVITLAKLFTGHRDIATLSKIYIKLDAKRVLKNKSQKTHKNNSELVDFNQSGNIQNLIERIANDKTFTITNDALNALEQAISKRKMQKNSANAISQQIA